MLVLLASLALADSITLDTGATIEGDLARYEFGGDCQLSVTEGELAGVILIVPCHRVQSFVRTAVRAPVPIGLEAEVARAAVAGSAVAGEAAGGAVAAGEAAYPVAVEAIEEVPLGEPEAAPIFAEPDAPIEEAAASEGAEFAEAPAAFYDEPLFPVDAATPIAPEAPPVPVAAPRAPAPSLTPPSDGPRMAPRMDEPTREPATTTRSVSF